MNEPITLEPPITESDVRDDKKPKRQPPYTVIIENDDHHAFDYVVEVLQKVFGKKIEDAALLTMDIHQEGRKNVWTGSKEVAELKVEQVKKYGNDVYAEQTVKYSLICYMEPLPQ